MIGGGVFDSRRICWLVAVWSVMALAALPASVLGAGPPAQTVSASASESLESAPLRTSAGANGGVDANSPAPALTNSSLPSGTTRLAAALGAVLALIFVLRWAGQRTLGPGAVRGGRSSAVRVLSRTPLGPRQQVVLLRVGKRVVVVGDSGGRMSALCEIAEPDEVAALVGAAEATPADTARAVFGSVFRRAKEPFEESQPSSDEGENVLAVSRNVDELDESDVAMVGGLLDKVRGMQKQFKSA